MFILASFIKYSLTAGRNRVGRNPEILIFQPRKLWEKSVIPGWIQTSKPCLLSVVFPKFQRILACWMQISGTIRSCCAEQGSRGGLTIISSPLPPLHPALVQGSNAWQGKVEPLWLWYRFCSFLLKQDISQGLNSPSLSLKIQTAVLLGQHNCTLLAIQAYNKLTVSPSKCWIFSRWETYCWRKEGHISKSCK